MTNLPIESRLTRALNRLVGLACTAASLIASLTLVGWQYGSPILTNLVPGAPTMNPLTAICILLMSVSLWLKQLHRPWVPGAWLPQICAALLVGIGSLKLLSLNPRFDFGVDLLLFHDQLLASRLASHMAVITALAFVCLGVALLTWDRDAHGGRRWSEPLFLVGLTLSLIALVGHAYGAPPMRVLMSVNTAIALVLLSTAAIVARPDQGFCKLLLNDSPGGAMMRRVIPAAVALPLILGWLQLKGEWAGLYGLEFGTAFLALALASILVGLTTLTGRGLDAGHLARRNAEAALRTSLERQTRILEANLVGVITVQLPGRITEANSAFLEMLGYRRADLPIETDTITPPEWRGLSDTARQEIAERGVATPFEKEYLHRDGSRIRVLIAAAALSGTDGEVMAFVVDIGAKRQAELEIQRMRLFLDSIIENLPNMVFVKDARDLRFVQFNRAGEELLGFGRDELIGKSDRDFFPAAEADSFTAKDRAVLETRQMLDIPEESIQIKSGEVRILHTKKVPILDREGTPQYLLGISEDITDRKRAEQQLASLNTGLQLRTAELESANKELEAFSYSVSHDLRAPLRHINGFAGMLMRQSAASLDPKAQHYLETIANSAKSMGVLIDDLLAFSRMGRTQMQDERVNLADLIAQVRGGMGDQAAAAEWHIAALPVVHGDPAMLRLVFTNLLANALKYAGRGQRPVIEVGTQSAAAEVIVYVRDNGVGFDMKYAHKLFGVFQRLHSDDEFEGTGIGLANVRRIVNRHGGRVWAEGVVDGGATFYLALPRPIAAIQLKEVA